MITPFIVLGTEAMVRIEGPENCEVRREARRLGVDARVLFRTVRKDIKAGGGGRSCRVQ